MSQTQSQHIKFSQQQRLFMNTLRQRVDQHLKANNLTKNGNYRMYIKTAFMFALFLTPYFFMVLGAVQSLPVFFLCSILMGLGIAGIGLSVMHDANHGSYSKNPVINSILSYSINMLGGHNRNWQMQHNTLHHTYTNIDGHDEDIDAPMFMLRFSPHSERRRIHRFQFLYAWFFYGLLTLMWSTTKDFKQISRYREMGLLTTYKLNYKKQLLIILMSKLFFYAYMIVIPMLVLPFAWWQLLLGYIVMQFTSGLLLSTIFQSAHVVEDTKFPMPDKSGNMENDWAVHQLYTTANFAPRSRVFSWFIGGLNYQVEHHLFPSVCHVHYKRISEIVKATAHEFNFPYHSNPTFAVAVWSHAKMLWRLGRPSLA